MSVHRVLTWLCERPQGDFTLAWLLRRGWPGFANFVLLPKHSLEAVVWQYASRETVAEDSVQRIDQLAAGRDIARDEALEAGDKELVEARLKDRTEPVFEVGPQTPPSPLLTRKSRNRAGPPGLPYGPAWPRAAGPAARSAPGRAALRGFACASQETADRTRGGYRFR